MMVTHAGALGQGEQVTNQSETKDNQGQENVRRREKLFTAYVEISCVNGGILVSLLLILPSQHSRQGQLWSG